MLTALATVLVSTTAFAALQPENPQLRESLTEFMHRWQRSFEREDADALGRMLAPDAYTVDLQGNRMNAAAADRAARDFFRRSRNIKVDMTIRHVQGNFSDAVVWSTTTVRWSQRVGRHWEARRWTGHYADSVRNRGKGWMFYFSQQLPAIGM